jgi:hypothetical protein
MTQDYCKFLNLPGEFFNKEELMAELTADLTSFNNVAGRHWRNWGPNNTPFNQAAVEWANSLGAEIVNAEVFYTKPNGRLPWHVDMNPPGPVSKLNFVWGSDNHVMEFAEIKNPMQQKETSFTKVNSHYILYTSRELSNITAFTLDKPALLNVGKPHSVLNRSNTGRWCLCMILWKDGKRIMWNDALELFSEYVLN